MFRSYPYFWKYAVGSIICALIFLFLSTVSHKKSDIFCKGKFKTDNFVANWKRRLIWIRIILQLTKHTSNIPDKMCPFLYHHHIRNGSRCFLGDHPSNSSRSSLSDFIFECAVNDLNNERNADTSETIILVFQKWEE